MSRKERLESFLKTEISSIIIRTLNDSRIGFISITNVKLSKDHGLASIYYSQIGSEEEREKTRKGLHSARKFIKGELGKELKHIPIPNLKFIFDESIERGVDLVNKINKL